MPTRTRTLRTVAATGLTVVGAVTAALLPAAAAQAASSVSDTVYSSDLHARTSFKITWYGTQHAQVAWTNADIKADGKGAIMFIGGYGLGEVRYDHDTSGAGTSDLSTTDVVLQGPLKLDDVWIEECNGGSHDSPKNCDEIEEWNPYH